jgi:predicted ATP-dependent endonuclease of OLD family
LGFFVSAASSPGGKLPGVSLEAGDQLYTTQMGTGVNNIISMIGYLAESDDKIFLIEEIENDLHPKAIKKLLNLIKESARDRGNQFFISTHSKIMCRYFWGIQASEFMGFPSILSN